MLQANFPVGSRNITVYGLTQYDYGQVLEIYGLPLPAVVECQICLQKSGGTTESLAGVTVDNVLTLTLPDTYLAVETDSDYTIYIYVYVTTEHSGTTVYRINLPVSSRPMPEGYEPGETSPFADVVAEVTELMEEAQDAAVLSESWAVGGTGTREGEDTNNSSYYATQAASSASDAHGDAVAAAGYASDAHDDAVAAHGYKNDASGSAEDANTYAGHALNSKNAAAASALVAEGYADGKQNGEAVASGSPYYHNNAKYYSDEADSSATAASGKADEAAASALVSEGYAAGTQGGEAVTSESPYYENNSKYYATQAAASATSAAAASTNLAPTFSTSTAYSAGDYVLYNGTLYRFNSAHAAGAWTGSDATAVKMGPEVSELKSDLDELENDLFTVDKQLDMAYLLTTKGAIKTSNGSTITDNSYMRTGYIPVKAGQVIKYTLRTKATYSMVSVYDSSKVFVEGIDGTDTLVTGEYTVGQDGFVIFSCINTRVSYASIQIEDGVVYKLYSSIETVNDRITNNFVYFDLADLLTEKGTISTTGASISNNSYFRTDYIPVLSGMVFVYGLRTATNYAMIAMYDTQKTAISQSIVVGTDAMVHSEFTVPQNGYIRISCLNTRVNDKKSYFTLKGDRIYNLLSRINTAETDISTIYSELKAVPEYYKTHIEGKTDDIIANMNSVGIDGETAVFITDTHWDSGNKKSSPSLVNYILQHSNVNVMLCGGDIINQGTYTTQIDLIQSFVDSFRFADVPLPIAFGNHDNNRNKQNPSTEWFDRNTVFAMLMKPASNYVNYLSEYDWSFIFDKTGTKTRFLFIDTGISGEINSNAEQAVFESLNSVPDGYHVIIVAHWLYSRDNSALTATGENVSAIVDAYNSRGTATINGVTYDYTNAKGKCECILIGHSHDDAQGVTSGGVPWLVSDSDNLARSKNVDDRTAGTITEQCFDVITFDYANSGVKCCRIGAGSDRTFASGSWS